MSLEAASAKRLRRTKIREAIFMTLETAGVLALTVLAPNSLSLLGRRPTRTSLDTAKNSIRRLAQAGLLEFEDRSGQTYVRITKEGRLHLTKRLGVLSRPNTWDKKWRIVIFDIKESRRAMRSKLRDTLRYLGFVKLQNSVWVHPFDHEELILLLKAEYMLGKEVLYIIADQIENDSRIRRHFGL